MAVPHRIDPNHPTATWKPVPGWETAFLVSEYGHIKRILPSVNTYAGRILCQTKSHNGYLAVQLCAAPAKILTKFVHRLVAEAFVGPCPSSAHQINHIDGDKQNNHFSNLEWVTSQENHIHASENGLKAHGANHGNAKLNEAQAREIRTLKGIEPQRDTAKRYGVDQAIVGRIQRGVLWKHA